MATGTGWVSVTRYSPKVAVTSRATVGVQTVANVEHDVAGPVAVVGRLTVMYAQAALQAATPGVVALPRLEAAASAIASADIWSALRSRRAPLRSSTRAAITSSTPMDAATITTTAPRSS